MESLIEITTPQVTGSQPSTLPDGDRIGYYITDGTTGTISCPPSAPVFHTGITFSEKDKTTFAYCGGSSGLWGPYTSCNNAFAVLAHPEGFDVTIPCMDSPCLHISLYDYRNGGPGPGLQYLMGCAANLELHGDNLPDSGAMVFLQRPTEGDAILTSTNEVDISPATAIDNSSNDNYTGQNGRHKAGVIAGAVVGSLAGIGLIVGALVVAYRMGKRASFREGEESSPRSFRDKWRSIPRPTIRWTKPGPQEQYDVDEQQPVAVHEIASPEHRTETDATRDQQPINLAVSQEQASGQARSQGVELSAENRMAELTAESFRV